VALIICVQVVDNLTFTQEKKEFKPTKARMGSLIRGRKNIKDLKPKDEETN
jgi:hypothetical protein